MALTPDQRDVALSLARQRVADHLHDTLTETIYSGSRGTLAMRISGVASAEKTSDPLLLRSALVELAVAAASWASTLDAELPAEMRQRRSPRTRRA